MLLLTFLLMCLLATDGDNVHIATEDKESSYQSTLYAKHCCTNNTGENSIKHLTVETGKIEITFCQQSPVQLADCDDWFKSGCGGKNGIYMINPDGGEPFEVFCEMRSDGGGWIVFQRRLDGSVDFYLNWSEYRNGFGNLTNEFWLGLDKIHRLTMKSSSLRVDLEDFDGGKGHAKYSKFAVGDEASKYELTVNGYSGNAGDALKIHNGHMFTTKDNDNDLLNGVNCAGTFYGAWWYDNCYDSNLNGIYKQGPSSNSTAIIWKKWNNTSLKYTEMKVRKVL